MMNILIKNDELCITLWYQISEQLKGCSEFYLDRMHSTVQLHQEIPPAQQWDRGRWLRNVDFLSKKDEFSIESVAFCM